jgi:hypothetical protein
MQLAAACRFSRLPQSHASADLFNDQYRFFLQPAKARPSTKLRSSVKRVHYAVLLAHFGRLVAKSRSLNAIGMFSILIQQSLMVHFGDAVH